MDNFGLNSNGELVHHDEFGKQYVLDEVGNRRPPLQGSAIQDDSRFTTYDTADGHCGMCGRLTCNGGCFK